MLTLASYSSGSSPKQTNSLDFIRYKPTTLSYVDDVDKHGKVQLVLRVYLPFSEKSLPKEVQVKVGIWQWKRLSVPTEQGPFWSLTLNKINPETSLQFRFRDSKGKWVPLAPLADLERVYGTFYIPKICPNQTEYLSYSRARVLMETTLEGLLAGYEGGVFAPRSREELFRDPIIRQILRTDIPNQIAELGIDDIMVTTSSSVADRSHLNPRFNYLAYDIADIDWQLGYMKDMQNLLKNLQYKGISVVPDLVFAHQVKAPFPGSLDQIQEGEHPLFVDSDASMVYDYGTWMFKLEDPIIRKQVIEKIIALVMRYSLRTLRLGYLDGLIHQYSQREVNYGEVFLQELKQELNVFSPKTELLGEAFAIKDNLTIQDCIDTFYAPYGFWILAEICKPVELKKSPLMPDFDSLLNAIHNALSCPRCNAVYAQLHDEAYASNGMTTHRNQAPWAHGFNMSELAKKQGEKLVELGLLPAEDLLDYIRRSVRNSEALTLFCSKFMYMFTSASDALALGCLDAPGNWKFYWDALDPEQLRFWKKRGLPDKEIYLLHKQHRLDMIRLRQIFREYTFVIPEQRRALTQVQIQHTDPENSIVSLWRYNPHRITDSLLIVFNFGPVVLRDQQTYQLPIPIEFEYEWEVLFDGDWIDPLLRTPERNYYLDSKEDILGYSPGKILSSLRSKDNLTREISLELGSFSLIVLKACLSSVI